MKKLLILAISIIFGMQVKSQNDTTQTSPFSANIDIMSRYLWRGMDYGSAPSLQPMLTFTKGNFTLGSWGAYAVNGSYGEADFYAQYTIKSFTLTVSDYFTVIESPSTINNNYFDYSDATGHVFEGSLGYEGPEKFPLKISANVIFYGNDKDPNNPNNNNYSAYAEATYTFNCVNTPLDVFVGMTPKEGYFGNTLGVVNAGIKAYKDIEITDKFTIPTSMSIITNPQLENIHFVFGFSF